MASPGLSTWAGPPQAKDRLEDLVTLHRADLARLGEAEGIQATPTADSPNLSRNNPTLPSILYNKINEW